MSDLDQPAVWRIVQAHFLLLEPGWWILRVHHDMAIILGQGGVIDPSVRFRNGTKGYRAPSGRAGS